MIHCEKAYGYIRQGWCQGKSLRNRFGSMAFGMIPDSVDTCCLHGALYLAYRHKPVTLEIIRTQLEKLIGDLAKWNDAPERTKQEVYSLLRERNL